MPPLTKRGGVTRSDWAGGGGGGGAGGALKTGGGEITRMTGGGTGTGWVGGGWLAACAVANAMRLLIIWSNPLAGTLPAIGCEAKPGERP